MKNLKVAFICAFPRKMNFGMFSVDLSIQSFLLSCGLEVGQVKLFNVEESVHIDCGEGRTLDYLKLEDPETQLADFDLVVFWGDFLTSQYYLDEIIYKYALTTDLSENSRNDLAHRVCLLDGCSDTLLQKTLILGGNILSNEFIDRDSRYFSSISRLYQKCLLIAPRDPMSAFVARYYAGQNDNIIHGTDGAFFFPSSLNSTIDNGPKKKIGFSFSRSMNQRGIRHIWFVLASRFAKKMAKATDSELEHLNWHAATESGNTFSTTISSIKNYDLVITDTYHCAINCWREGVPAICLGRGALHQRGSLSDKKKELLYLTLVGSHFYVFVEGLSFLFRPNRLVRSILQAVENEKKTDTVKENIKRSKSIYAEAVKEKVLRFLNG